MTQLVLFTLTKSVFSDLDSPALSLRTTNHLESRFPPPYKDFRDLGFAMDSTIHIKSLFPAQSLSYADWLHAFSNFQLVAC